jgi:hypothetical protein
MMPTYRQKPSPEKLHKKQSKKVVLLSLTNSFTVYSIYRQFTVRIREGSGPPAAVHSLQLSQQCKFIHWQYSKSNWYRLYIELATPCTVCTHCL